jgi:hypothetical protein
MLCTENRSVQLYKVLRAIMLASIVAVSVRGFKVHVTIQRLCNTLRLRLLSRRNWKYNMDNA